MGSSFDLSKIIPTPASVADTIIGVRQNNYNAHLQEEMLARNQEFNAAEAEKSRVFSQNERIAQQEYNTQERLAAQKYNTQERLAVQDYNSIANQVNQLKAEGVNPAVYFSGSSGRFNASTPASSSGAISSIPSAATASSSGMPSPVMGIPQLASGMADIMNAMTNANVGEHSINLMDANVEKVLAEAFDTQQAGFLKQLEYDMNRAEFPYKLKKMMTDIVVLEGLKTLQEKEGKKFDRESDLLELKQATERTIAKLKGNEALTAEVYYNKCGKIWDSQITANVASANESNASASLKRQQKLTEEQNTNLVRFTSECKEIERNFNTATFGDRMRGLLQNLDEQTYDILLKRIESEDKDAYTTLQRIILGKSVAGEDKLKKVLKLLTEVDRSANLPGASVK